MDTLFLRDLSVQSLIGIHEWERRIKQTLLIDLELAWDISQAAKFDSLSDALDYAALAERVKQFALKSSFALLESFAENLANDLIDYYQLSWLRLTVKKPGAISNAHMVGVCIERP